MRTPARLALALGLFAIARGAHAQDAQAMYQRLRAIEASFPRIPNENILMGTFDAATGKFRGRVSTVVPGTKECTPDIKGKPRCTVELSAPTPPLIVARGRTIALVFDVVHSQGSVTATVNGATVSAPASAQSVTVPVTGQPLPGDPTASRWNVDWRVTSAGKSYRDSLIIDRMSFGLGSFTIPVLPVAIIYDPPQDSAHDNVEVFSASSAHGSSVTVSLTRQSAYSVDVPTIWTSVMDMEGGVKSASDLVAAAAKDTTKPNLDTLSKALGAAASLLPSIFSSASANQQDTKTEVNGTTHQLSVSTKKTYKSAQLGPGKGDVVVYFKNFRVAWFFRCCVPPYLAPLGADMEGSSTVAELQSDLAAIRARTRPNGLGAQSHLDSLSIQALLALDPFVAGGNNAALPTQRFDSLAPPIGLSSVLKKRSFVATESEIQQQGITKVSQRIEKDEAGLLSGVAIGGWGPDSSGTITSTLTHSNLAEQSAQHSRQVDITLGGPGLDTAVVNVYYDRVFGSFATRIVPSGPDQVSGDVAGDSTASTGSAQTAQPAVAGRVTAIGGSLPRIASAASGVAGRIVTLTVGGRVYQTTTDARGHYVFRLPHYAAPAQATLTLDSGAAVQSFALSGARTVAPVLRAR